MTEIRDTSAFDEERRRMTEERDRIVTQLNINSPADDMSPDDAAAIERANQLGEPVFSSRREAEQAISAYQNNNALAVSPRLRSWLSEASNAAIARDDVPSLSFVERVVDIGMTLAGMETQTGREFATNTGIGRAIGQGQRDIEMGRLAHRTNPLRVRAYDDRGPLNPAERQRLETLRATPRYQADGVIEEVAGQFPIILGSMDAAARRSVNDARNAWRESMGSRPFSADNFAASAVTTPIAIVGSGIAGAGGAIRGGPGFMYEQEAGNAFEEYRQFVDADGNQIDPLIAADYANRVGMINAAIEFASLATGAKILGVDQIAQRFISGGVRDSLRRYGYGQIARRALVAAAGGALNEGATEAMQEGVTIALGNMAREAQGGEWDQLSDDEVAERIWESFRVGATVGAVMGAGPVAINLQQDLQAMGDVRLQQDLFNALHEGFVSSRTRERSPATFARAVETLTRDGPLSEVKIDAQRFTSFFQERDEDAHAQADRLGIGREALQQALDTGGEITMPMSTYATQIVGTDAQQLAQHIRMGPDKLTPAEVRARFELGVDIEKATSEMSRLQSEFAQNLSDEEAIYQRLLSQFNESETFVPDADKGFARAFAKSFVVQAKAGGMTTEQFMNRIGLSITGPFGGSQENGDVAEVLGRVDNARADVPRNLFPRDRVRTAKARAIPRRVTQATEAGTVDNLNYNPGDYIVSEDVDGATPWVVARDIFENTYVDQGDGRFAKRTNQPIGYYVVGAPVTIQTLEGPREANTGDVVLIGARGEMWPVTREEFDARYDTEISGFDQARIHPVALRFGSDAEVQDLLHLISIKADLETILDHPIMRRVDQHAATLDANDTMPEGADATNVHALDDAEFVINGEPATYEDILADALDVAYSYGEVRQERKATMVIGPFAAGKSTFIKLIAKNTHAAVVDADQVKSYIPDYEDGYNTKSTANESAFIRWRVRDAIMAEGDNLVIEHVGNIGKSLLSSKAQLEAQGYTVDVVHIRVAPDEAARRATRRFIETGRWINPVDTREIVATNLIPQVFEKIIAEKGFESYIDIDANPGPGEAEIIGQEGALQVAAAIRNAIRQDAAIQRRAGAVRATEGKAGFYQSGQTDTEEFRAWFKQSKVTDENGDPLVVYTGTTGDFDVFDQEKANPESDLGAGFYFTNTLEDLAANYAGFGPDLTQKIQIEAERIAGETERNYDDPEVIAEARAQWVQNDGVSMPVYLSFQNPVIIGGERGETFLDYDYGYDPETDEYADDPSGKLWEFVQALRSESNRAQDGEVDSAIDTILERAEDGMHARDVMDILKADEQFGYHTDESGKLISNEIVRRAFERIGFDGYIDRTVNQKFGSERKLGRSMAGMHEGTVHYIAFRPEQIKSAIGNSGAFDPNNPSVLFQDDAATPPLHSALLRAVEALPANTKMAGQEWLDRILYEPERVVRSVRRDPATNKPMMDTAGQPVIEERLVPRRIRLQGVKQEEIDWTGPNGLVEWLSEQGELTQKDVAAFIAANGVQVEQTVLGGESGDGIQRQLLPLIEEQTRLYAEKAVWFDKFNKKKNTTADDTRFKEIAARLAEIEPLIEALQDQRIEGEAKTKWSSYVMDGGQNYRELLLRLPESDRLVAQWEIIESDPRNFIATRKIDNGGESYTFSTRSEAERFVARQKEKTLRNPSDFQSSHWDQPNILAHVRFNERVDADGQRTLFIEELQSDWHQQGRERGYANPAINLRKLEKASQEASAERQIWHGRAIDFLNTRRQAFSRDQSSIIVKLADLAATGDKEAEALARSFGEAAKKSEDAFAELHAAGTERGKIPDAPFKNNAWAALAIKVMIRRAIEGGFDQIAWIPGQEAVERFDLATMVERIGWGRRENGNYDITITRRDGGPAISRDNQSAADLTELVGHDVTKRITEDAGTPYGTTKYKDGPHIMAVGEVTGPGLQTGGHGMRAFYDKILPNIANGIVGKTSRVDQTAVGHKSNPARFAAHDAQGRFLMSAQTREVIDNALSGDGFDGYTISPYDGEFTTVHRLKITEELRSKVIGDGLPLFQGGKGPRGQISFGRDERGIINRAMVRFFENRNLSTPLHEIGGHLFLETLRMIANESTATDQARTDWAAVLEWFGVTDEQWSTWSKMPERQAVDKMRPHHERFARGFEVFVMEGKSPSLAMQSIFSKFKHWMISIYKSIQGIPNAPVLTPEIRAVFSRLMATQEEIDEAMAASGIGERMTREQFGAVGNKHADKAYERYIRTVDLARAEAEAQVEREALGELMADQTRIWRAEERRVKPTVRLELLDRPEWVARDWLSGERIPDGQEPIRLNTALALEEHGAELIDRLPAGILVRDIDTLTAQALNTRKVLAQTPPKRMVEVIAQLGGISTQDPNALDARAIIGTDGAVPVRGNMKRKLMSESGLRLDGNDGLIQRLWEEGYFGAKPTTGFMQLAGRNAITANMESLQRARAMYGAIAPDGMTAEEFRARIWKETGWTVGDDGLWRFEIDTSNAQLMIDELRLVRETDIYRLDQVLEFPALFEAYPQLASIPTDVARGAYAGSWVRRQEMVSAPPSSNPLDQVPLVWVPRIIVRAGSKGDALSILLHEVQHAIQDIESFATGGDPATAALMEPKETERFVQNEIERRLENVRGTDWFKRLYKNNEDAFRTHERTMLQASIGWKIYERLAGEVEARDVQNRLRLTPEERREIPPGEYDPRHDRAVKKSDRIVSLARSFDSFATFEQNDSNTEDRPTVREFLDRLDADLRGEQIYSVDDFEAVAAINDAQRIRDWFSERGVDLGAKPSEIKAQIKEAIDQLSDVGLDADTIASMVNGVSGQHKYDSGAALLNDLANLPTFDEAVRDETKRRMRERFGDMFNDGTAQESARAAVHSALHEKVIEIQLDTVSRATGGQTRPVNAAAKIQAEKQLSRMTIKEIRGFNWFLSAERRQAKLAVEAANKGNKVVAQQAGYRQLANFHLYRMARDATAEMESAVRYFKKFQRLSVRVKIDQEYLDQIDGLLEQYELRQISGPEAQRRQSMTAWAKSMEDRGLGHLITIDPDILERNARQPFQTLRLEEARALLDAVKNIEHLGRLKDKLLDAADQRRLAEVVNDNIAAMEATGALPDKVRRNYSGGDLEKAGDKLRGWHAELTRMEFLFRYLDGKHNGSLWRSLWLPFAKAADKESLMMHGAARQMTAIWNRYSRAERNRMFKTRYEVPALRIKGPRGEATSFTRQELISIALNVGNDGNVRALVDGFDWFKDRFETDYVAAKKKIVAELDTVLTERDWETVQAIWNLIAQFRDEAFALQKDLTGLESEAVQSESVTTRYGELAGGYYPLKFDRSRDLRVEKADVKQEVQELHGSNWTAPMTRKGHLIERKGSGGRPVKLSLTVFSEHVQNVIHDVSYRRAVIDVNRIINDKAFADAFIGVAGRQMYDQLAPWIQSIASDRTDPSAFMWKALQKLRGNTAIAAMGYRISTATAQLTGFLQAVPMLGGPEISAQLAKLFAQPHLLIEKSRYILARSEFMRSRVQTFDRDVRENLERMERDSVIYPVQKNAFMLVGMFDWAVSSVVWLTAYEKARGDKVDGIDPMDDEAAIRFADSAVRQTQSAGLPQDLPAVMRGNQVNKLLTMFYSYFSVLYNWTAYDQVMNVRKGRLPPHVFAGNLALIYIVAPLMAEALAGRWGQRDDEDDDEYRQRFINIVIKAPFMTIPVVRDIANAVGSYFDYQMSPIQSGPAKIVEALEDAAAGRTFSSERTGKTAALAVGYAFGVPTPQMWVTGDYVADQLEGEEQGFDPVEAFLRDSR